MCRAPGLASAARPLRSPGLPAPPDGSAVPWTSAAMPPLVRPPPPLPQVSAPHSGDRPRRVLQTTPRPPGQGSSARLHTDAGAGLTFGPAGDGRLALSGL